ncbi:terminase small subunit [Pseudomonas aeruginosa]|uniref:terminase small subunit n=1 Tax=Pseudomonas aeruginosa TaxID=287 RepID=UPI000DE93A35|nr:terminase small subunit [Pseudomonas aeruginosa]RCH41031.1 terminase small subunit [Pseudomonas aeruginosa]HBN9476856.1 terminase small subunit [Pseudomonas aeruginosa]HEC0388845.1 terminase small subunit [Pseudomonas aeruginosa]HEC0565918.1 terminase small subunit [Pseudomonas aeruginosa]HEC0589111.1 terminase small subunit [Pseudomonas aeruginosa]
MALTPKQEAFCLAYLKTGNASEAYRLSYDAKNMKPETVNRTAKELIDNPKIAARMAELNASAVTDAVMTRQEALERLSRFARTDLADLLEFGSYEIGEQDGQPVIQAAWKIKDSVLQDPQKMAAISELAATKDGIRIKTHSPLQAIQQLAKMQGWESATKHEVSGPDGGPLAVATLTKEDYMQARREMLAEDDC